MAKIINSYYQELPDLMFVGKKYTEKDKVNNTFGSKWNEWFMNGWFALLEKECKLLDKNIYEDSDAYLGLMSVDLQGNFNYYIGMFVASDSNVPEGFDVIKFPASRIGICWLYGAESEIYCHENECMLHLVNEGYEIVSDNQGILWIFERYACPRFTTPDEHGNVILDMGFFIK